MLGNAFGPDDRIGVRVVKLGDGEAFRPALPSELPYGNVAACVGGGAKSLPLFGIHRQGVEGDWIPLRLTQPGPRHIYWFSQ